MRARLADNVVPTQDRISTALQLGDQILSEQRRREELVAYYNLDRAFSLPASNWGPESDNEYVEAFEYLSELSWNRIRHLRLRSRVFTGYDILTMSAIQPGTRSIDLIPDDFDERVLGEYPGLTVCGCPLVERWATLVDQLPDKYVYRAPPMLGEVGWWIQRTPKNLITRGFILNSDVVGYQERLSLMHGAGILSRLEEVARTRRPRARARVLEVGGGYGALAYALTSAIPCEYWVVDLPESLLFSGLYLSLATGLDVRMGQRGGGDVNLLPNYLAPYLQSKFDLVINTLSLCEMSPHQQDVYGRLISGWIGDDGVFFDQNQGPKPWRIHFQDGRLVTLDCGERQGVAHVWTSK